MSYKYKLQRLFRYSIKQIKKLVGFFLQMTGGDDSNSNNKYTHSLIEFVLYNFMHSLSTISSQYHGRNDD